MRPRPVLLPVVALVVALVITLTAGCSTGSTGMPTDTRARPTATTAPSTPSVVAPVRALDAVTRSRVPSAPCVANTRPRFVRVSLSTQRMWLCARHTVVHGYRITSGMSGPYTETPKGDYRIQRPLRDTTLTLASGKQYRVKYWIPFDSPLYGFHDSSWQKFPYGSAKYTTSGSHGCVHMPLSAIAFLYRWAPVGTAVHIGR